MRRGRLAALVAVVSAVGLAAFASTATSAEVPPTVGFTKALASTGHSSAAVVADVTVTLTGHAGETGNATDIELVLDVSGSMAGTKITDLKNAAKAFVNALDARDGADDGTPRARRTASESSPIGTARRRTLGGLSEPPRAASSTQSMRSPTPRREAARTPRGSAPPRPLSARARPREGDRSDHRRAQQPDRRRSAATRCQGSPNNIRIATVGIGSGDTA